MNPPEQGESWEERGLFSRGDGIQLDVQRFPPMPVSFQSGDTISFSYTLTVNPGDAEWRGPGQEHWTRTLLDMALPGVANGRYEKTRDEDIPGPLFVPIVMASLVLDGHSCLSDRDTSE